MNIADVYEHRKNDHIWNTSYPLYPMQWKEYRVYSPLSFENEKELSFYIHIPFCKQLCTFCEYTRMKCPDQKLQTNYLNIIAHDIRKFKAEMPNFTLTGFDIGGGTPTALDEKSFSLLMNIYNESIKDLSLASDYEPSIEATFHTISRGKCELMVKNGIRRLSFGVQSSNDNVVTIANRNFSTMQEMERTIQMAHDIGIDKINLDFMYGLNRQTRESINKDLEVIRHLHPEQVTLYELRTNMIAEECHTTPLQRYDYYKMFYRGLIDMGYYSHFGQNTFSCNPKDMGVSSYIRHRMRDCIPYKGFGISAQSMNKKGISYNIGKGRSNINELLKQESYNEEFTYSLPPWELASKYIAISAYSGAFSLKVLSDILGKDAIKEYKTQIEFTLSNNLMQKEGNLLRISETGFKYYGAVFSLFFNSH